MTVDHLPGPVLTPSQVLLGTAPPHPQSPPAQKPPPQGRLLGILPRGKVQSLDFGEAADE